MNYFFMKIFEDDKIAVYECSDGRFRAYKKESKKVVSYPRVLMEQQLGRPLEDYEQVHHKNENKGDNDPENLSIMESGKHQSMHARKYYDKIMICPYCSNKFLWSAKSQKYMNANINRSRYTREYVGPFCSRRCAGSYSRREQLRRNALSECK